MAKPILGAGVAWLLLTPLPAAEPAAADAAVRAAVDEATGRVLVTDAGRRVLAYNYREVAVPAGLFTGLAGAGLEYARKHAKPRSDYLHPLYGPDGEELTADWNKDHPHHRGIWKGSRQALCMTVFEHSGNHGYPGDYVEYPLLPWFQPTFPQAGRRHALDQGKPLVLRYRIWIRSGPPPSEAEFRQQWNTFNPTPENTAP